MIALQIIKGIDIVYQIVNYAVLLYCALSIFMRDAKITRYLSQYLSPLFEPFRGITRALFPRMPLDFSPIFAMLALGLVRYLLVTAIEVLVRF